MIENEQMCEKNRILDVALGCVGCGSPLRGAAMDGVCGECGEQVRESCGGRQFIFSDEVWRRRMRRGLRFGMWLPLVMAIYIAFSIRHWFYGSVKDWLIFYGIGTGISLTYMGYVNYCLLRGGKRLGGDGFWRGGMWGSWVVMSSLMLGQYAYCCFLYDDPSLFTRWVIHESITMIELVVLPVTGLLYVFCFLKWFGKIAEGMNQRTVMKCGRFLMWLSGFLLIMHSLFFIFPRLVNFELGILQITLLAMMWVGVLMGSYAILFEYWVLMGHSLDWGKVIKPAVDRGGKLTLEDNLGRACLPMSMRCDGVGCGYNLQGLPLDLDCPECGYAIKETISDGNYMFSDRLKRERLAIGLWILVGLPIALLALKVIFWSTLSRWRDWTTFVQLNRVSAKSEFISYQSVIVLGMGLATWYLTRFEAKKKMYFVGAVYLVVLFLPHYLPNLSYVRIDWRERWHPIYALLILPLSCYAILVLNLFEKIAGSLHRSKPKSIGLIVKILFILSGFGGLVGIIDYSTDGIIGHLFAITEANTIGDMVTSFSLIPLLLGMLYLYSQCLIYLIGIRESIGRGDVRRQFVDGGRCL